jgi:hypothetical protein
MPGNQSQQRCPSVQRSCLEEKVPEEKVPDTFFPLSGTARKASPQRDFDPRYRFCFLGLIFEPLVGISSDPG